jgi:hypothetical protein
LRQGRHVRFGQFGGITLAAALRSAPPWTGMVQRLLWQQREVLLACLHGMDQHLTTTVEYEHDKFKQPSVGVETESDSGIGLSSFCGAAKTQFSAA